MVVQPQEVPKSLHSTQIRIKVEIEEDTAHPIAQVGKVPLAMQDGRT